MTRRRSQRRSRPQLLQRYICAPSRRFSVRTARCAALRRSSAAAEACPGSGNGSPRGERRRGRAPPEGTPRRMLARSSSIIDAFSAARDHLRSRGAWERALRTLHCQRKRPATPPRMPPSAARRTQRSSTSRPPRVLLGRTTSGEASPRRRAAGAWRRRRERRRPRRQAKPIRGGTRATCHAAQGMCASFALTCSTMHRA